MARTRPADRMDELVRAATETFLRNGGPDRTQMVDVARALGVAKGTLYLYVEGKEALLALVLLHADQHQPVAPAVLPVPIPAPGAIAIQVEQRIRDQGQFPRLDACLAAKSTNQKGLDAAQIRDALAEVYDVLAQNRTAIRLVNLASRTRPELATLWFAGARGPLLTRLATLIQRGADDAALTAPPNTEAAARVVVETCMWFAVHRAWDPSPDGVADDEIRATVLHMLAGGLGLRSPSLRNRNPNPELPMHDLLIQGGTVVDGTGAPATRADVAINGDRITAVGHDLGPAHRVIDATGLLVTPGWVDIHTHYDGQVTWDPMLTPSSLHGVTTVVVGSCGVGFAPVRPERREWLIGLMEGVEDIPGAALTEGMKWGWETFPEYLDALDKLELAVDFGTQIPHGAVRTYVMGERGAANEPATPEDVAQMADIVRDAVQAGALGFSTSRTLIHKGSDGVHVPGTFAETSELQGIAKGMQAAGGAVFQMTSNHTDMADEFTWMRTLARDTGNPVSFNLLQTDAAPDLWRHMLSLLDEAHAEGLPVRAQVCGRPSGVLMSWQGTAVPFLNRGAYLCELHHLPWEEKRDRLRDPATRAAILADTPVPLGEFEDFILSSFHKMYRLGNPPEYEPDPSTSAAALAEARGCTPQEIVYDWLMEDDAEGVVYFPIFNYSEGDHAALHSLMQHPRTVLGLGDGGAHCGAVCDASLPTYMLTHWVRDRHRGPRLPLEQVVRMQTADTADLFGLADRGVLAPGYLADLNLIDLEALSLDPPRMVRDLPAGGRRFMQGAGGYQATIKSGQVVMQGGVAAGPLPGRLLRGRPAPPTAPAPNTPASGR